MEVVVDRAEWKIKEKNRTNLNAGSYNLRVSLLWRVKIVFFCYGNILFDYLPTVDKALFHEPR